MLNAVYLKTEALEYPLGISFTAPRFSWKLEGEAGKYSQHQSAYQILCGDNPENLTEEGCLWDSGKVASDKTDGILCPLKLKSRQRVWWKVRIWDENDQPGAYSEAAFFELGLLNASDWTAKWVNPEGEIHPETRQPASYLRKTFPISEIPIKARLYMTACGMYRAFLNGAAVDTQVLTPGTTQYNKRLQVQTYDITALLRQGENILTVTLGDGWFRGMNGMQRNRNVYGEYIALLGQLELTMSDGSTQRIVTDESWQASQSGPIRFTDFMQGERYDANCAPGDWHGVHIMDLGYEHLIGTNSVPIMERERCSAKLLYADENEAVLDFGQNLSGYVSFTLNGSADTKGRAVTLEHGEALDADGKFTMANLEGGFSPKTPPLLQKVTYIASDEAEQHYKPSFSTFGFRYVKVIGWPGALDPAAFTAIAVYSQLTPSASFSCSNELINQLVKNTLWSQKSNFADVPTDCPQRERAGYTGDAQVFVKTGSILMDSLPFYRKWLADLRATQDETGKISNIAPMQQKKFEYFDGSAGWGDAIIIVPYALYRQYGDEEILRENYDAMRAWVDYELREAKKDHPINLFKWRGYKDCIWDTGKHWGEWLEPGQNMAYLMKRMYLGCPETATAYLFYSCKQLSEIAAILGKSEADEYAAKAEKIRQAYRVCFLPDAYKSKRQCLSVRPIFMGLANDAEAKTLAEHLNDLVVENGYHLNTGFLSTPHICSVLAEYGYWDTAYRLLEQETLPGWLYPVKRGATTIWEKWDGVKEDGSLDSSQNHYSYGAVVGWLFDTVAGIRPTTPGYKQFQIAPHPGGSLTWAEARMDTTNGGICSRWSRKDGRCELTVEIPVNTLAEILLPVKSKDEVIHAPQQAVFEQAPEGISCELGSGQYSFAFRWGKR